MNDNNILACIEYAKQSNLACADEAMEDYTNIKRQAWQEIEDWARSAGFVLVAERAGYIKAAQQMRASDGLKSPAKKQSSTTGSKSPAKKRKVISRA